MANSKRHSKKQRQPRVIDFKKIRRKIGRKLPPPVNATKTEIKFRAILLPEQSVAFERKGLAVSRKGLTLKELLQQISHYNPKVRRDALQGVKELFLTHPSELKLHKYAVVEKVRECIRDVDKIVREASYNLFKSSLFPACKGDNQGLIISLVLVYIFSAMTHFLIDVRMMAFKLLDLLIEHYPTSFSLHADEIFYNYGNVLRNHQFYFGDKSKLRSVLTGLARCLLLLPQKKDGPGTSIGKNAISGSPTVHWFEEELLSTSITGFPAVGKARDLLRVLLDGLVEFIRLVRTAGTLDTLSYDCMSCILSSIYIMAGYLLWAFESGEVEQLSTCSDVRASDAAFFEKVFDAFPIAPKGLSDKTECRRYLSLDILVAKVFLKTRDSLSPPVSRLEKFLTFVEAAVSGSLCAAANIGTTHSEKHAVSLVGFIPNLVCDVESEWRSRLLQAFTEAFECCEPGSSLKLACLGIMEAMVVLAPREISAEAINWLRELPSLLLSLGSENCLHSQAALRLLLRMGQQSLCTAALSREYDRTQQSLCPLFCASSSSECVLASLPWECQELAVSAVYYFSSLGGDILRALAAFCLWGNLEGDMVLKTVQVVHLSYKAGHVLFEEHLSFLITLLVRLESPALKRLTSVSCLLLGEMGDGRSMSLLMEKAVEDHVSDAVRIPNACAVLRILASFGPPPLTASLCRRLHRYMLRVASLFAGDEGSRVYFILPCFVMFVESLQLLGMVIEVMLSQIERPGDAIAVSSILVWMLDDIRLRRSLSSSLRSPLAAVVAAVKSFMLEGQTALKIEERHKLRCSYDRLESVLDMYGLQLINSLN